MPRMTRALLAPVLFVSFSVLACGSGNKPPPASAGGSTDTQLLDNGNPQPSAGRSPPEVEEGKHLLEQKHFDEAREVLVKAVAKYPSDPSAAYYLAEAYDRLGEKQAAETYFKKTLELAPGDADASNNLAAIYLDAGRTDEAIALCQSALSKHPDVALLHFNLARGLGQAKTHGGPPRDGDGAAREFQAAIKIDTNNADFHAAYASFVGLVQGHNDAAMTELTTALSLANGDPDVLAEIAGIYRLLKDFPDCVAVYGKAIAAADTSENRTGRGICEHAENKEADAENDLRAAVATNANDPAAYYWLGNVLAQEGKLKDAVKAFEDCQRVDPNGRYAKPASDKAQALRARVH
jgi:tetratricopeptide (TPR) repeat protein